MRDSFYIVFDRAGAKRMTKNPPSLGGGQYAVSIAIEVPDALFRRDIPQASLVIPESFAIRPPIVAEVLTPDPVTDTEPQEEGE